VGLAIPLLSFAAACGPRIPHWKAKPSSAHHAAALRRPRREPWTRHTLPRAREAERKDLTEPARLENDIILPTPTHGDIRLRCITQPDAAQAALLERLGIVLPKRMRLTELDLAAEARRRLSFGATAPKMECRLFG
jgi:hypothetical protein